MSLQPPMMGSWNVVVLSATPFAIHGDQYLELAVRHADGDVVLRVPAHTWKIPPAVGDRIQLTFLMGQVTGVEVISAQIVD